MAGELQGGGYLHEYHRKKGATSHRITAEFLFGSCRPDHANLQREEDMSKHYARREFLKTAAASGTAFAAGELVSEAYSAVPVKWDREADVVVIGAGAVGL